MPLWRTTMSSKACHVAGVSGWIECVTVSMGAIVGAPSDTAAVTRWRDERRPRVCHEDLARPARVGPRGGAPHARGPRRARRAPPDDPVGAEPARAGQAPDHLRGALPRFDLRPPVP